jgi:hypothetical protein
MFFAISIPGGAEWLAIVSLAVMAYLFIMVPLQVLVCYWLYQDYRAIPKQYRQLDLSLVWLLAIPVPVFTAVWNFFVYPALANSYKAYFESVGRRDVSDCGRSIGFAYCICYVVPGVNLAALVLLIVLLAKAHELKSQIPVEAASA